MSGRWWSTVRNVLPPPQQSHPSLATQHGKTDDVPLDLDFRRPLTALLTLLIDGSDAHRERHGGSAPDEWKRRTAVQDRHRSPSPPPSWGGAGRQRRLHAARLDALRQHWVASGRRLVPRANSSRARRAKCRFLRQAPRRRRLVEGERGDVRLVGHPLRDDGLHRQRADRLLWNQRQPVLQRSTWTAATGPPYFEIGSFRGVPSRV